MEFLFQLVENPCIKKSSCATVFFYCYFFKSKKKVKKKVTFVLWNNLGNSNFWFFFIFIGRLYVNFIMIIVGDGEGSSGSEAVHENRG